ncbi:MAG: metallophosphoesterase [Myxococcales bacterium]|nr:metallophosphoesterase [Myxococcales bacterium]
MLTWLTTTALAQQTTFAVIGDFGDDDDDTAAVAAMVRQRDPDLIVTVGDNDYSDGAYAGSSKGLELGVGQHYGSFVQAGRFFPTPGDHDWGDTCDNPAGLDDYLAYFDLPSEGSGNERYYDFVRGPVHFFAVHSVEDCEPDGATASSEQARWLRETAAASTAPFKVAYMHHPPWSSGEHRTDGEHMQWPWAEWGFQLVLAGHDHDYERIWFDDVTSVVVGIGGVDLRGFGCPVAGSQVRFDDDYGALFVTATDTLLSAELHTVGGVMVDRFEIGVSGLPTNTDPAVPAEECRACGCGTSPAAPVMLGWLALGLLGATRTRSLSR